MDLDKQKDVVSQFRSWFEGGNSSGNRLKVSGSSLKSTIEDNRRRYRMILEDADERINLGLSALPSTKSTSIVDNAVVDAINEYYATDAITFTAADSSDSGKDHLASWLTQLFQLRAKQNGFWVWHMQSLKAGFVDGLEAAMVRWRKEAYDYQEKHFYDLRSGMEISEEEYEAAKLAGPAFLEGAFNPETGAPDIITIPFEQMYRAEKVKASRTVTDMWECMQLKPGENILWDFKNPILDLNRGQWCIVIAAMQKDEILSLSKAGTFKRLTDADVEPFLKSGSSVGLGADYSDKTSITLDSDDVDMGSYNTAEVWIAFEKRNCQWFCSYSLGGELELTDEEPVNDMFFGGRTFDRLPVVLGASDLELWEAIGRGIPKLIAPIEDELTDHRNNVNDIAKQAVSGKYRINDDSDVDLNMLLNDRIFYAKPGEVEKLDFAQEMAVVMRAADVTGGDIAALAPVSMADPNMVGRGNARGTLGGVQLAMGSNNSRLSARLMVRNVTFMEPLLRIVAEMEMAFESDQTRGRIAAKNAKINPNDISTLNDTGQLIIDFSRLDFDVEVQINAGLGVVPKQQKAAKLMQYTDWAKAQGIPLDIQEIDKQLKVLNGFNEDQFLLKNPPPPPPPQVDDKFSLSVTFSELMAFNPQLAGQLLNKALVGAMEMSTSVKPDKQIPSYLRNDPVGSPSHPLAQQQNAANLEQYQGPMGGM